MCILVFSCRSIDFQCFSKKDYNLLYINLKEIVNKLRNPTVLPACAAPVVNEYRESLSTKKSVRFMMQEEEKSTDSPRKEGENIVCVLLFCVLVIRNLLVVMPC